MIFELNPEFDGPNIKYISERDILSEYFCAGIFCVDTNILKKNFHQKFSLALVLIFKIN